MNWKKYLEHKQKRLEFYKTNSKARQLDLMHIIIYRRWYSI